MMTDAKGMSDVQRYWLSNGQMVENECGYYVKLSDYAVLAERLKACERRTWELEGWLQVRPPHEWTILERDKEVAERQRDQLAAERDRLKAALEILLIEANAATYEDARGDRYASYREDVELGNLNRAIHQAQAALTETPQTKGDL